MRLVTIGTGAVAPHTRRVCSGHLVEQGDVRLLMDCGSGVVHRMAVLGERWADISHVALTHFDADHTSDLAILFLAWRYGQLPPRHQPVTIFGPTGTQALLERLAAALWDKLLTPGFPVIVRELGSGDVLKLDDGILLEALKVPHTDESVAYSIRRGRRRIVYTGDTGFDDGLGRWAKGCDLLLTECSLPASMAVEGHLTPELCGELARLAEPAHLALVHFYPPVESVDIRGIIAPLYDGPLTLAEDGWSLDIED